MSQETAERSAAAMFAEDFTAQALGIEVEEVGPGRACLNMVVRDDMSNGHKTCHGGMIFSLADAAFAYACNSYNQVAVAESCHITFLTPAYVGEHLRATAREVTRQGRNGLYDVSVRNQDGKIIAEFRGKSRSLRGQLFPAAEQTEPEQVEQEES